MSDGTLEPRPVDDSDDALDRHADDRDDEDGIGHVDASLGWRRLFPAATSRRASALNTRAASPEDVKKNFLASRITGDDPHHARIFRPSF